MLLLSSGVDEGRMIDRAASSISAQIERGVMLCHCFGLASPRARSCLAGTRLSGTVRGIGKPRTDTLSPYGKRATAGMMASSYASCARQDAGEKFERLGGHVRTHKGNPGDVAGRLGQGFDEAASDRVRGWPHHNRYGRRRPCAAETARRARVIDGGSARPKGAGSSRTRRNPTRALPRSHVAMASPGVFCVAGSSS